MKNVIIVGAFVNNKGAQSMLFTVVDEIRKYYPSCNISILVNHEPSSDIINTYNFNFLKIDIKNKLYLAGGFFSVLSHLVYGKVDKAELSNFKNILKETDLIIDISGYALSSKFTRNNTINYLSHISLAEKHNIPIVLFPQSFGPFNYNILERPLLMALIKKYLRYPLKIYAREKEGYEYLKSLNLSNVNLALDTVFQKTDDYNLSHIFKGKTTVRTLKVKQGAVAIIPNVKTINSKNESTIYRLYNRVIRELTDLNKNIYLIRHSTEDLKIIENIYNEFHNYNNVFLIKDEYNAIELHGILSRFDYVIASRYHSIVHSYKSGTPALVLGWAVKYKELLQKFNQSQYQFDSNHIDIDEFIGKLRALNSIHQQERNVILSQLNDIHNSNFFYEIFSLMTDDVQYFV